MVSCMGFAACLQHPQSWSLVPHPHHDLPLANSISEQGSQEQSIIYRRWSQKDKSDKLKFITLNLLLGILSSLLQHAGPWSLGSRSLVCVGVCALAPSLSPLSAELLPGLGAPEHPSGLTGGAPVDAAASSWPSPASALVLDQKAKPNGCFLSQGSCSSIPGAFTFPPCDSCLLPLSFLLLGDAHEKWFT